jgi:uncharacterized Fe-S cluster-containing radical SAM superfamily protein
MTFPFNPIERAKEVEAIVISNNHRLYHRFRPAPYYGGIASADAVGCCFLCAYCWNYQRNLNPRSKGRLYSAREVAGRLLEIAARKNFRYVRLTGAEPILGEDTFRHFLEVLKIVLNGSKKLTFILETNGLILGFHDDLARRLAGVGRLSIRIAIKGWDEASFQKITGAQARFFYYPIYTLVRLRMLGLDAWPAVMEDLFTRENLKALQAHLVEIGLGLKIEKEELERYPFVMENLKKRQIELAYP